ncbi:uncharacterized protein CLUP02_13555 [Colletotrichum lupini]|uniref:Uncharacterized protein n=1 Tax=Colletotrichum lupini TaxID=145971 RepID=A0A9Q8T2N3_9PEZI|nr:uncharacterized protein CLUP02_13555 [Colletotrichum lupini]UQC88033.1 hypothetical protein CLUP02_13555 [Colletotrichum lupini]
MANDAPPGLLCPLCLVLGHLKRLFRATNIPVVIEEAEENLHDDTHQGSKSLTIEDDGDPIPDHLIGSVTTDEGGFLDPVNGLDEEEAVCNLTGVSDNPKNSSWRLGDANTRPLISATSRNPTARDILRSNNTSGPFCRSCAENRDHSSQKYRAAVSPLHCSGCRRDHPSSLFSVKQRQEEPDTRICIGREGHLRLREHRTFDWDDEVKATFEHTNGYASWASEIGLDKRAHRRQSPCLLFPEEDPLQIDAMACFKPFRCMCIVDGNEREGIQLEGIAGSFSWNPSANECPHYHREDRWSGDGTAYIHTEFSRCSKHDGCVILSHRRSIRRRMSTTQALEPCDSQWYQALDPSSHDLVDEIEFKNVTWCEDARCRNFYRFREYANVGTSTS